MAFCEPQFSKLKEEIKEAELKKQKIEAGDTDSPIDNHVKIEKDKAEEDYDSDDDFDNYDNCYRKDGDTERARILAIESLKSYTKQTGVKYKLKRVLKADRFLCAGLGLSYVITFIAEEGSSDDEHDKPPLEILEWVDEIDKKISYKSGGEKDTDKVFEAGVYWQQPSGEVSVNRCGIITK